MGTHPRSHGLCLRTLMIVSLADRCRSPLLTVAPFPLMQLSEFQARLEDSKEMVEGMLITTNVEVWFRQSSEWCAQSSSSTDENPYVSILVDVTVDVLMIWPFECLMNQLCCRPDDSDVLLTRVIAIPSCLSRIGLLDSIQNMVVESIQATAQRICQDEDLLLSLYQMDTSAESGSVRGAQQQQWGADKDEEDGDFSGDDKDDEEQHRNQYQNQPAGKSTDVAKSPFRKQCSIAMEDLDLGEEVRIRLLLRVFVLCAEQMTRLVCLCISVVYIR